MAESVEYLVTGAGGGIGSVSRSVVELLIRDGATVRAMVHREDDRADAVRALGAQVVVGDLTQPQDVVSAMRGVKRMFFNMSVSPSYLTAATIVCAAARDNGGLDAIVNMSQMTVSQMTLTSTEESHQHRLHWLAEQVMDWSGLPVTHGAAHRVHRQPAVHVPQRRLSTRTPHAGSTLRRRTHLANSPH